MQQGIVAGGQYAVGNPRVIAMFVLAALGLIAAVAIVAQYQLIWRFHYAFNRQFERGQRVYGGFLAWALVHRATVVVGFSSLVVLSLLLFIGVGQDFFPSVDAGQIRLHVRTPAGTRIEQSERYFGQVQEIIRRDIPADEVTVILDNIGIPNSSINLSLSDGSINAPSEGEILVSLSEEHKATADYIRAIRNDVSKELPDLVVWSAPSDIATQVLNFGLPASIDVQVAGPQFNADKNQQLAMKMLGDIGNIPGVTDKRLQQVTSAPDLRVNVDRSLADQIGVTQKNVANDLLISLSSTNQIAPNFWLSPQNGVSYPINVQTPQYKIGSLNDLTNTPVIPAAADPNGGGMGGGNAQLLGNLATLGRSTTPANITHYQINPTFDVLLGTQYLDLGRVSKSVSDVIEKYRDQFPKGTTVLMRGQVQSMNESFKGLAIGLIFAVVLVYLLLVINFQSWLDPMIILMALPGAASGILWMLWATHTSLSVPSLMGAMMSIGVATSNSILMITFANDQRKDAGQNAHDAAFSAGLTRLRPVVMTALAMIIGMLPMSLGLGEGGEQNAPLGRAVIGGLLLATFSTLIFVPVIYSLLRNQPLAVEMEEELK